MTQSITIIRAAVLIVVMATVSSACSKDPEVSSAIGGLIDDSESRKLRLADATPFEWDQVYLFDPYTPRARVCVTLQIKDADCVGRIPFASTDDGEMSIAFVEGGQLVQYVPHLRSNGDFTPVPTGQPLTREAAVFLIERVTVTGGPDRRRLVLEKRHKEG